jgi:hypothetical protein
VFTASDRSGGEKNVHPAVASSANVAAIALRTPIAGPPGDTLVSVEQGERRDGTVGPPLVSCQFGSSPQLAIPR